MRTNRRRTAPCSKSQVILFLILTSCSCASVSVNLCPVYSSGSDEDEFFVCPGSKDPDDLTECCKNRCCSVSDRSALETNHQPDSTSNFLMITSIVVMVICLLCSILVVLCCCVPGCLFYDSCTGDRWTVPDDQNPWVMFYQDFINGTNRRRSKVADRHHSHRRFTNCSLIESHI